MESSTRTGARSQTAGAGQGITIVAAGFLPVIAIVALAPAVPSVMAHFAGVPNATTLVPLMVTAPGIMIALFSPFIGWATDRAGRRALLLAATLIYGLLGILPVFLDGLGHLFATRLGLGLAEAAVLTITNTLIGDYFDTSQRRVWLTVQNVAGPVFGTAVIALAGLLTARAWNGAFMIYAVAFPILLAMLVFVFEPSRGSAKHDLDDLTGQPFPWKAVSSFSAVTLFAAILYYVFIVQGGLAFDAIGVKSPKTLGLLISFASIGVPIGALAFGILSRRLGAAGLTTIFLGLIGVGMIGIGLAPTPASMAVCAIIQQIGAGMAIPSLIFWAAGSLTAEHRGRGMGAWSSAFFLGQFISPLIVGALRGATGGILSCFVVMGVIALLGGAIGVAQLLRRTAPALAV